MTSVKHICIFLAVVTVATYKVEAQSGDLENNNEGDPRSSGLLLDQSRCWDSLDWEPYKNEKCLKIFNQYTPVHQMSYNDAKTYCKKQYDANLVTIPDKEKQAFLETYLKFKNIDNNVWIGLEYKNEKKAYEWTDGTKYNYSNWASGNPRNKSDYCVRFQYDSSKFGIWSDDECTVKNMILCEKVQAWPITRLQATVVSLKKKLHAFIQDAFPVGLIYVQLPKDKPPKEIWPWTSWRDVSHEYSGVFFRVYGTNSAGWGSIQEDSAPVITTVKSHDQWYIEDEISINPGGWSGPVHTGINQGGRVYYHIGLAFYRDNVEVRPRNMAIRVWRRVK